MSSKRPEQATKRTRAREQALKLLFSRDFVGEESMPPVDNADVMDDIVLERYTLDLYNGVLENLQQIDDVITGASTNWSITRMPPTDRAILRIAAYELLFRDDVPAGASINEAVELAQQFGGEDDSYRFVNGVLGKIASQLEKGFTAEDLWRQANPDLFDENAQLDELEGLDAADVFDGDSENSGLADVFDDDFAGLDDADVLDGDAEFLDDDSESSDDADAIGDGAEDFGDSDVFDDDIE